MELKCASIERGKTGDGERLSSGRGRKDGGEETLKRDQGRGRRGK